MIEAVYAIIIVAFASLGVLALFNHLVRGSELREAVTELLTAQQQLEGRLSEVRMEIDEAKFDTDSMDDERIALEKRHPVCSQAAALESEPRHRKDGR